MTCRIIGDGPGRAAVRGQARGLGVSHKVEFQHELGDKRLVTGRDVGRSADG